METEFKLQLPPGAAALIEQAFLAGTSTSVRLRARYFDTPTAALRKAGLTLRLRQEGSRWVQTAKYAGHGMLVREEHEVDVGGLENDPPGLPDVGLHAGTEVGKRLSQVMRADRTETGGLQEMFSTDVERLTQLRTVGSSTVELALDRGEVRSPAGGLPVEELEIELQSGDVADLAESARQWCAGYGLWLSTESKAAKGWRLAAPGQEPEALPAAKLPARREATGAAVLRSLVSRCLDALLPHASAVAAGLGDDEAVHQLRVGLRRLRTVLRELAGLTDGVPPDWEPTLALAFGELGRWRDHTNIQTSLLPALAGQGGPDIPLPGADASDLRRPLATVRDAAFQQCLISLMAFAASQPEAGEGLDAKRTRAALRRTLGRLYKKLRHAAGVFEELDPQAQHRARRQLKRLRYLVEFVGPLFDAHAARDFIERLKPAQDALGLQNDEAVALEALRELAASQPQAWFGVGWYSARRARLAKAGRKALQRAVGAKAFWEK